MAKAPKRYNVPPQITEEDRRKAREEVARAERERTSDSDIPESDKMALKKMLEGEKGEDDYEKDRGGGASSIERALGMKPDEVSDYKKGGSVRKYAEGGLARGSVRGGGIALRGIGKGSVY